MNKDLQDMIQVSCEEIITDADEAQMEYERGERADMEGLAPRPLSPPNNTIETHSQ